MKLCWLSSLLSTTTVLLLACAAEAAELRSWQFNQTQNQLSFRTDEPVEPQVQLLNDPVRLVIELPNTRWERRRTSENQEGAIDEIEVRQADAQAQIVIELDNDYAIDPAQVIVQGTSSTDWTVQLPPPQRLSRSERRSRRQQSEPVSIEVLPYVEATLVEAIELTNEQLILRTDKPITDYSSGWDQTTSSYQIRLASARLATITNPSLAPNSPLLRLRTFQVGEDVVISLQPAPGVQIGELTQTSQSLALSFWGQAQRRFTPNTVRRSLPGFDQLPNVANQRVVIALDPGHGGRDPGAVGIGGLRETDIVLEVGLAVADLLRQQGATVVLTRTNEQEIDLEPRVSTANRANANLFVSIHANAISMSRPDVNGVETYFYSSTAGQELANYLQESVLEATNLNSRGVKEARFYVLRQTRMPAVLIEVGFVTGRDDAPRLADSSFRRLLAQAIARGILQYVVNNPSAPSFR